MAVINKVTLPSEDLYDVQTLSIPFGQVDSTSTATAFTATIPGITSLYDGVCVYLKNGVITSASGWTLNINDLGAKPVYQTMEESGGTTTIFNVEYTGLFVYNSSSIDGGCWYYFYVPTKVSELTNDSNFMSGMTILRYGSSTWNDFLKAYQSNHVVYCRASSNSNPSSGAQLRLAFMAYVGGNDVTPTEVEFQYYRSVSSHTQSQQGDQVYVYKLTNKGVWSVIVREASVKVVAGAGLGGTYSNGTMTLTGPTKVSDLTNDSGYLTNSSTLDATKLTGTVPTSSLPSYVDDVIEYSSYSGFPATGETGKIYVDTSTNLAYRWGGSAYVEISPSLALGTTSSTAFRGDYGDLAYTHAVTNKGSAFTSGLYKITTNSEGHVTSATAVQKSDITALGIPAQDTTYEFDGTYNASTNKVATESTVSNAIASMTIDGLTDILISSPTDGQILIYNSTDSKWENIYIPSDDTKQNTLIQGDNILINGDTISAVVPNVTSSYVPTNESDAINGVAVASAISTITPLYITITGTTSNDVTTYSSNKTYSEISAAFNDKRPIYLVYNNNVFQIESYDSILNRFYFSREYIDNGTFIEKFTINSSSAVTFTSKEIVMESAMYQYPLTINIANDNSVAGVYGSTSVKAYSEGDLFWINEHQLARALTDISTGDTLTLNTNYSVTTVASEFKRMPTIINSLIDEALAEYDDGDSIAYGNVEEGS